MGFMDLTLLDLVDQAPPSKQAKSVNDPVAQMDLHVP